jgi:hypothetical protein
VLTDRVARRRNAQKKRQALVERVGLEGVVQGGVRRVHRKLAPNEVERRALLAEAEAEVLEVD